MQFVKKKKGEKGLWVAGRATLQTVLTSGQLVLKQSLFFSKRLYVSKLLQIESEVRPATNHHTL